VITPQAWIKKTEMELSDSEILTLPAGGFECIHDPEESGLTKDH
jgi:hypothetical protein